MRIGAPPPVDPSAAAAAVPTNPAVGRFNDLLQRELAATRGEIEDIRAAISAIRSGQAPPAARVNTSTPEVAAPDLIDATDLTSDVMTQSPDFAALLPYTPQATGSADDPYGWRAMTRQLGDQLVGEGFGALFERQIDQESGYNPDVVFGRRVSTAGAEGIAQLMPQYYPNVDRTNPQEALVASVRTMHHYLTAHDGDLRKALASYNAGLGRVRSLVDVHGANWEAGLPAETKSYLAAILGNSAPIVTVGQGVEAGVFGGRGPGGVLTMPLDGVMAERPGGAVLQLLAASGSAVRAPADGRVTSVTPNAGGEAALVIDHGNGWQTALEGVAGLDVQAGQDVRRGQAIGTLGGATTGGTGALSLRVALNGRALDPSLYLLRS